MGYGWGTRGRMCPMKMVDDITHYYRFEIARWKQQRDLRRHLRVGCAAGISRVEEDRLARRDFPGRMGDWPIWRPYHARRPQRPGAKRRKR